MGGQIHVKIKSNLKCFLVTGTGRCGTKLFSKLLSLGRDSICEHEKIFRHESMVRFHRENDFSWYLDDIHLRFIPTVELYNRQGKIYGVSSGHMYFSIPYLYRILSDHARFILLVRSPEEFVRSALARGFFDSSHPHPCVQILPSREDTILGRWDVASPFEKNLWYWALVNQFVISQFQVMPERIYRIVRIEDVNEELVNELCDFLELKDVKEEHIRTVLAQRVNASPGLGDDSDLNPYSQPIILGPKEEWSDCQLSLLEQYAGRLWRDLYGSAV